MNPSDPNASPKAGAPSEQLHIAVTFKGRFDLGPTKLAARLSSTSIYDYAPLPGEVERAVEALKAHGFTVTGRGMMTLSVRGTKQQFEQAFGTELTPFALPAGSSKPAVYYPAADAPWRPDPVLQELIDDAYIQWPHIDMGPAPSAVAPERAGFLSVLKDVPKLLKVTPIHEEDADANGHGVRVVMIDTGFAHGHPFFQANGFSSSVVLAPGATHRDTDPNGHGTGESANIFANAPGATFIGVKLVDDDDPKGGASFLEGLHEALKHDPHVISISLGYDLRAADKSPLDQLPRGLTALELEIQAAIAKGIIVVCAAGNGHYSFPGQMPEVLSVGGAYPADPNQPDRFTASDFASAFTSRIYSGRQVPDFCGLVGPLPMAANMMLPVPAGSKLDRELVPVDATRRNDGWAAFSGTSAAAPQIAGICALLRQRNSRLPPAGIKAALVSTARDVMLGHASPSCDPAGLGVRAGPGGDGATGAGLVNAYAAWSQVPRQP